MTIYKPSAEAKSKSPDPEVVTDSLIVGPKKDKEPLVLPSPHMIAVIRHRQIRFTKMCIFFGVVLVFAIGVVGGIYLYKHLAHKAVQGWCRVEYEEIELEEGSKNLYRRHTGQFNEHIELDTTGGKYERIEVPDFDECKKAIILHDFEKNFTTIVDNDAHRCFVMPLNRTVVQPPKNFWDLVHKLQTGYYLPDTRVIRVKYHVLQPPLTNLEPFGQYIIRECNSFETFRLQADDSGPIAMTKRSVENHVIYGYATGPDVIKTDVLF